MSSVIHDVMMNYLIMVNKELIKTLKLLSHIFEPRLSKTRKIAFIISFLRDIYAE